LDKLDQKFESKFEQLEQKFESKFEQLEQKFESKFEQLERKFDKQDEKINGLSNKVSEIKGELTGVNKRLENLEFISRTVGGAIIVTVLLGIAKFLFPSFTV
jgi:murein lipoprotein